MNEVTKVYVDGASRGNPGPAAYAFVILRPGQSPIEQSATLGKQTNNIAEYTALCKALEHLVELGISQVHIHSDSELMVKQINGLYKVKNADIQVLYQEAKSKLKHFSHFEISHVRREQNARADELCNIVLDGENPKPASSKPASKSSTKSAPGAPKSDGKVRSDCLECLRSAQACWLRGEPMPSVELVWDQLWSVMEEAGVLK